MLRDKYSRFAVFAGAIVLSGAVWCACGATQNEMEKKMMKYLFAAVVAASSLAGLSAANAAGGCGPGWHPNYYGRCVPNAGPVMVAPRAPVVVVPRGRVCPPGMFWRYGRCRYY